MQVSTKLLVVSGAVGILCAGAFGAGCSDDPEAPKPDSSTADVVVPPTDAPVTTDAPVVTDAATDADAAAPLPRAKVLSVHAAHGLPSVRFCFATGQKDDGSDANVSPLPPLPNDDTQSAAAGLPYPAVFPGTGGPLPDLGNDLSQVAITPYFIDAATIKLEVKSNAKARACDELLGKGDAGLPAAKYWKLPTIPKGTLAAGKTILLAGTGCPADYAGQYDPAGSSATVIAANCGGAPGNLKIESFVLDNMAGTDATKIGLQILHLSPGVDNLLAKPAGGKTVGQTFTAGDAGFVAATYADPAVFGALSPATAAKVSAPNLAADGIGGRVLTADGGTLVGANGPVIVMQSWGLSYVLTTGDKTGAGIATYYPAGKNYTSVVVGSPLAPQFINPLDGGAGAADAGGVFNGKTLHVLVFPSDPTIPKFTP
jgi:hypothetical protein